MKEVADVVCAELEKIQAAYTEIINSGTMETILAEGAQKAQRIARKKLNKVQRKVGIDIFRKYRRTDQCLFLSISSLESFKD